MSLIELLNNKLVVDKMSKELDDMLDIIKGYYEQSLKEPNKSSLLLNLIISEINRTVLSWKAYTRTFKDSYNKELDKKDKEIAELKEELAQVRGSYNETKRELAITQKNLDSVLITIGNIQRQKEEEDLLNYIRERSELLAGNDLFKRRVKQDMKGENAPSYKHNVNNDDLITDYKKNNNKITKEMIKKYNMTYQGLKERLQSLEVYQGRRS